MKRPSQLILLFACLVIISALFSVSVDADKRKKSAQGTKSKASRNVKASKQDDSAKNSRKAKGTEPESEKDEDKDSGCEGEDQDPDLPPCAKGVEKLDFMRLRAEYIARLRGVDPGFPHDPFARGRAMRDMERQELKLRTTAKGSASPNAALAAWTALGPKPLPNGQSVSGGSIAVSGRITSVAVDPTNPSKIYLGAAQGGVWRSTDGGTTWVALFDAADSLAVGALAIAPSSPSTLYVGTGEYNGCADCFFGAGLYRIDNADSSANLVGPINPVVNVSNLSYRAFAGRSISKILVHPTDPATIFVTTGTGAAGSGGNGLGLIPDIATRGLYRSTNATSAAGSVIFQKLVVSTDNSPDSPATGNVTLPDMVFEPGNPNNLIVSVLGINGLSGGIYRTTDSMTATPTFTQRLALGAGVRVGLAINKIGAVVTVYAATGEVPTAPATCTATEGAVRKSTDGGVSWSSQLTGGGGFCGTQCFYNIAVAVDPNDANLVYIGGNARGTCSDAMKKSTDGGSTFLRDDNGLHADSHALVFDTNTSPFTIYTGNDGGLWRRSSTAAAGTAWTNLNNAALDTLQFESIAVHPTDRNITIGGTQDNGTELQQTVSGSWINSRGGDGGYVLIDQSATDTTNVNMYHTFFNSTGQQIRYERVTTLAAAAAGSWTNIGCTGGVSNNGITCSDSTLFYAPMAVGPGTPNTVYFGSDRLYRSVDRGTNNTVVSQAPISGGSPVSTIAIAPQDDTYRLVGLQNGQIWATSTGASSLINITSGSFPANPTGSANRFVGRAIIDPNNKNIAYVTFAYYAPAGQGVWRINNLGAAAGAPPAVPSWTPVGNGIPSIPINAFAVDPQNSNNLYAGTDIGVYFSSDAGANWAPFGTGLPRVAVFGLVIQNPHRLVRIATHGRGMWEIPTAHTDTSISFSSSNYNVNEGDVFATITVTRSGNTSGVSTVDFASSNGTASQIRDYQVASGTLSFAAGETSRTFRVLIINDVFAESNETVNLTLSNPTGATLAAPSTATVTIADNDSGSSTSPVSRQFVSNLVGAEEVPPTGNTVKGNGGIFQLSTDELSAKVSLLFSGLTGSETGAHVHAGAPGVNGQIIFPLPLGNPINNFLVNPTPQQVIDLRTGQMYMNVHSSSFQNGEIRGQLLWNPAEEADFFVRQAYFDFLSRVPDAGGFAFWQNEITQCQSDVQCLRNKRVDVSNAFFYEQEFQQTAAYVLRLYRAAYGNNQPSPNPNPDANFPNEEKKLPSYAVFVTDRARVVGGANLAQRQLDLANLFVTRPEFISKYPASLSTADQFVDAVLATLMTDLGVNLTGQRANLINLYNTQGSQNAGRGAVMYRLADDNGTNPIANQPFIDAEYNRTFVLGQYFGYLRRNPDISGFLFWLGQVNGAVLRDVPKQHAMVCSFITSAEYQFRFGPVASRNNNECPQ